MAARLTRLTPEQEAVIPVYRDRWLEIGLSTKPGDRVQAQQAIADAYREAQLPPPGIWVWLDSPLHGAVGAAMLDQVRDQVWAQVGAQVWAQVREQVGEQVGAQVRAQVGAQVRAQVEAQVRAQVEAQVGAQVWAQVREQVGEQVREQVGEQVGEQVWAQVGEQVWAQVYRCGYGLHDANWLGFYDFFRLCGVKATERLAPLMRLAEHAGWWWPFANACILTPQPTALHRDGQGRLHNSTGPALDYAGAWAIHAWHGVRVPAWVIVQPAETVTRDQVFGLANAEQRRALVERIGAEAFVRIAEPKILHEDTAGNGDRRRLLAVDLPSDPDRRLVAVEVRCPSTGREYLLRVPPQMSTCQQALAWSFGVKEAEYRPEVET